MVYQYGIGIYIAAGRAWVMKGAANGTHHGHGRGLCLSLILMLPASGCLRLPPVYHSGASRAARHVPKSLPTDGLHHRRVVVKAAVLSAMACASRPAIAAAPLTTDRSDVREWSVAFLFTEAQLWETPTFPPSTFQRFAAAGAAAHVLSEVGVAIVLPTIVSGASHASLPPIARPPVARSSSFCPSTPPRRSPSATQTVSQRVSTAYSA